MSTEEIEKQIGYLEGMRAYGDEQQLAKMNALGLWQIALQLAKTRVSRLSSITKHP